MPGLNSCNIDCIQGSNQVTTQEFELGHVHAVELASSFDIVIVQSETDQQRIWAKGSENMMDHLDLEVSSGFLQAKLRPGCFFNYNLVLFVEVPYLSRVSVSGSGDIAVGGFNAPIERHLSFSREIQVRVNGSGDITIKDIEGVEVFEVIINGSGDVDFSGPISEANLLSVTINGSGDVDARAVPSQRVKAGIFGSGDVQAHALERLDVEIYGSGDVDYLGDPLKVKATTEGSGSVQRL
ncbi:MAG: DUF2807 domain-containing protein [Flavobacteriales bacterium]|nr:DUF2807 domain-containing protein [Flavobacteriales bacterium]